jgi:hypothetical protein
MNAYIFSSIQSAAYGNLFDGVFGGVRGYVHPESALDLL